VGKEADFQLQEEYTRWEAVSPGSVEKIPMFRADFPGFTLKIVEHSRYLLITQFGVVLLGLLHIVFSNCSAWKSVIYGREQVKKYDTE